MVELVFDNSRYLMFLLFVLIIIFVHYFSLRFFKKKSIPFANFQTLERISRKYIFTQNHSQLVLRILIVVLLCFTLAGTKVIYESDSVAPNTIFLIDASESMFIAGGTLFEDAKYIYSLFAENHNYASSVGVITYSSTSAVAIAPTKSKSKAIESVVALQPHEVSGTDIGTALLNSLFLASTQEGSKQVIVLSDGKGVFGTSMTSALNFSTAKLIPINAVILGETVNTNIRDSLEQATRKTGGNFYEITSDLTIRNQQMRQVVSNLLESENTRVVLDLKFSFLLICLILLVLEWALAKSIYKIVPY